MPIIGGNTLRSEGGMNAARTIQQLEHGIMNDSAMRMSMDAQKGGHYLNNPELTLTLAENAKGRRGLAPLLRRSVLSSHGTWRRSDGCPRSRSL